MNLSDPMIEPNPFADLCLDEATHTYTLNGRILTSVSALLDRVRPAFDRVGKATEIAERQGVPLSAILNQWDAARDAALERGTRVHRYIGQVLREEVVTLTEDERLPEMSAFDTLWREASKTTDVIAVEWMIYDEGLGIAGTVDAVLFDKARRETYLVDWKTGREFRTSNAWGRTFHPPFEFLDDCEMSAATLQLELYRLILDRAEYNYFVPYVVHLSGYGHHTYEVPTMRSHLEEWLATYPQIHV